MIEVNGHGDGISPYECKPGYHLILAFAEKQQCGFFQRC